MSSDKLSLGAEFPPASKEEWAALAQKALGSTPLEKLASRTYDGLSVEPLYVAEDWEATGDASGFPGAVPLTRGGTAAGPSRGWGIEPEVSHPDPQAANEIILSDLQRGSTGVVLRFDRASGLAGAGATENSGEVGVMIANLEDLDRALKGVLFDLAPVRLRCGASFLAGASMLSALWSRLGVEPGAATGNFGADPIGSLASDGELPFSIETGLEAATALAQDTHRRWPGVTTFAVDVSPYHAGGATEAQEIACALATGLEYLKAMMESGMDVDSGCRQIEFTLTADENFFGTIAKLRAARTAWARVAEACGASSAGIGMRLHSVTAQRMMTRRDPWVNILRTTSACFAAGIAGAEAVTVRPFNAALGMPDAFGRRIARNTQIILQEESALNRVIDPAGGSWYLENHTEALAEAGWREFQAIEAAGGMVESLRSGELQKRIASAAAAREKNIAKRKDALTGVSEFPNLNEAPVPVETVDLKALRAAAEKRTNSVDVPALSDDLKQKLGALDIESWVAAASSGTSIATMVACVSAEPEKVRPVPQRRIAESFEALRDASDAELERNGTRPQVFLVNMGRVAQHTARASFARNFFEAGGIEALTNTGFRTAEEASAGFKASGAKLAVLCGSDSQYAESADAFAKSVKAAGAERLYFAGRPGDLEASLQEAGVDEFIFMGCDVLASLQGAMARLAVDRS